MKLTVVGAGGFRTPAIYRALVSGVADVSFDEIVLYDADDSRFGRITSVLDGICRHGRRRFYTTLGVPKMV